jgi:hypothetical protein
METTRDQLAEALYQKGLALADIQSLEVGASNIMGSFANFFRTAFAFEQKSKSFNKQLNT